MLEKRNFYINGSWVAPKKSSDIEVINPATEKACAVISLGSKDDVNDAVLSAKEAFKTWGYSTREDRIALLETFYTLYKKRWNDITDAIIQEMGAPRDFASKLQTGTGASHTKSFIRYLKEFEFEKPLGEHAKNQRLIYEPKGVCALITPWNWPMNQVTLKVIPALASGCTMILKPSELAPLSAMILAELIDEAKFPKGVFNLVNGDGATTGDALTSHPDVNMISFTGSTRAGALISQNAAKDFKRV
jgi:aldehyde dehydrogenase (NAD+)